MKCSAEIPFKKIILYSSKTIDVNQLTEFLHETTGRETEYKGDIFKKNLDRTLCSDLAESRVREISSRKVIDPLPPEIELEKKMIEGKRIRGILYDAYKLSRALKKRLDEYEKREHTVVITDRLIGTLEKNGFRYHARTVFCSIPSLISISGIVEGPAKPREYYIRGERDLDFSPMKYDDLRMIEVIKSYLLQTVAWRYTGSPFCRERGCALFNSHWQREVIEYQLPGKLCNYHEPLFQKLMYTDGD